MDTATTYEEGADVLVVDDVAANVKLLAQALRAGRHLVRTAASGAEALEAVSERMPDLVLLDVNMPGMDGYETCRAIKQLPGATSVPILFVSASNETLDKVKAFQAGGVDYVTKPIDVQEVRARVSTHLGMRALQTRLRARQVELEQSNARLADLERWRDDLTHMLVHDMRSPVSAMLTYVDVLETELASSLSEQHRSDFVRLRLAAGRLTRMLTEILDVGRLEAKSFPIATARVDVREVIDETIGALGADERAKVVWARGPAAISVEVDDRLVQRVLINLIENATKVTKGDKRVTVTAVVGPRHVRLEVSDQGPGIPVEQRERIFDKFSRSGADAVGRPSTGLGLAFVRLAVEAMRGEVGVRSEEGVGTTFFVELPLDAGEGRDDER